MQVCTLCHLKEHASEAVYTILDFDKLLVPAFGALLLLMDDAKHCRISFSNPILCLPNVAIVGKLWLSCLYSRPSGVAHVSTGHL